MWRKAIVVSLLALLGSGAGMDGASQGPPSGGWLFRAATAGILPKNSDEQYELSFWDSIKNSNYAADYEAYLKQYPNGRFAALARTRLDRIKASAPAQASAPASPPTPATPAKPEPKAQAKTEPPPAPAKLPPQTSAQTSAQTPPPAVAAASRARAPAGPSPRALSPSPLKARTARKPRKPRRGLQPPQPGPPRPRAANRAIARSAR
ncbi:hypothetical protein [Cupriavidus sp. EM10]|uniref:hypothetical protein n=1 Tax=Cupriavidus sp. EM10 TaxID=2839983 RepID=UPI001CECEB10|nr:hypothetical protein [Cupriavidus sp. EM10]